MLRFAGKNGDMISVLEATCPEAQQITRFSCETRNRTAQMGMDEREHGGSVTLKPLLQSLVKEFV